MSWGLNEEGDHIEVPEPLPVVKKTFREKVDCKRGGFRYFMNVCTFGYSYVWWGWERWEREIDWLAMNGINIPLAFVGYSTY